MLYTSMLFFFFFFIGCGRRLRSWDFPKTNSNREKTTTRYLFLCFPASYMGRRSWRHAHRKCWKVCLHALHCYHYYYYYYLRIYVFLVCCSSWYCYCLRWGKKRRDGHTQEGTDQTWMHFWPSSLQRVIRFFFVFVRTVCGTTGLAGAFPRGAFAFFLCLFACVCVCLVPKWCVALRSSRLVCCCDDTFFLL